MIGHGTSAVSAARIFDGTFQVFIDGAETRKERNNTFTMYTIRCHAMAVDKKETSRSNMLIEEPVDITVTRRYSDFRKMSDIVKSYFPMLHATLPVFPDKWRGLSSLVGGTSRTESVIQKRVEAFELWLRALVKRKEVWQLKELLEFLDDSNSISSRLTWTWNNWQSPVMSVDDSSDLEQLQMDNLYVVLGRGSSVQAQGVIPMRNFVTHCVEEEQKSNEQMKNENNETRRSSLSTSNTTEVGLPFSINLTKNGLHTGTLSGRVLVRRIALREQVVQKLVTLQSRSDEFDSSAGGRNNPLRSSGALTSPPPQPVTLILDQLTSSLQVRIEGSDKVVSSGFDSKAKSFTEYRISVSINGRRWIVSRRYSEFYNLSKVIASSMPQLVRALPKFPSKSIFASMSKKNLQLRQDNLDAYLRELVCHPEVWRSSDLVMFLDDSAKMLQNLTNNLRVERIVHLQRLIKGPDNLTKDKIWRKTKRASFSK
jgi:hypothetical protein